MDGHEDLTKPYYIFLPGLRRLHQDKPPRWFVHSQLGFQKVKQSMPDL